jgi:hypothetical protein
MLCLMVLLGQLDNYKPPQEEEISDDDWVEPITSQPKQLTRRRSKLEDFLT